MTNTPTIRRFTPKFLLESAQSVLDQGYPIREAAEAMRIGKSQLRPFTFTKAYKLNRLS